MCALIGVAMVQLTALWLPILLSAVLVFIASSVIHMLLGYHRSKDWRKVPSEDDVMEALRRFKIPPGDYLIPSPETRAQMNTPEFKAKRDKGPILMMTVLPNAGGMGRNLVLWFLYTIVVGVFAGYVAGIVLAPGTPYLMVFRVTATVAFAGYALALWQHSIWYGRSWAATVTSTVDGLIYALLTGGAFGWLWP
jgi:Flp pilus assembly protein TadB